MSAHDVLVALGLTVGAPVVIPVKATPRPKPAMPNYAGLRQYRKARETGRYVGVYNGDEAGLDTDDGENPWTTVCEDHGFVVSHPTLALAKAHATTPLDWCEICVELLAAEDEGRPVTEWARDDA